MNTLTHGGPGETAPFAAPGLALIVCLVFIASEAFRQNARIAGMVR